MTLNTIKKAGLVLAIFDFSREISKEDINLLNLIKDIPNVIGVINKIDLKDKLDFNFLSQNLQNAYKDQGNNKEQQEKNFQFIMGMKTNDMLNNQNNNFNYNLVNSNINNNQKKKDDPFSNLVNF